MLAATLLNILWFIVGWKDGVSMQGLRYTLARGSIASGVGRGTDVSQLLRKLTFR